jgi:putative ABC transport system substrate-binding protein
MMGGRNADTDPEGRAWFAAFRRALQQLGWVEGRNFRADYRWPSGDLDRMRAIAKEFVDLKPDVMFAGNAPSVVALQRETRTIPIVFANLADPVGSGVVGSFAHRRRQRYWLQATSIRLPGNGWKCSKRSLPL